MSNELKDYGQLFCEAVDTIVKERLSSIKFDSTILCTIVDDKDKAQGKYVVSYSDAKFEAYAMGETKYNKNNNVYVQIPGGDWNEQKFIIAKKTDEEDTPATYQYPFDSFVDITGNIIKNTPKVEGSLIANGYWDMSDPNDIQILTGEDEQLIWAYNIEGENIINSEQGEQFSKYTRLGIQAQFQSWLAEDSAVSGSYGLRLRVEAEKADAADIETDEEYEEPKIETVYYDFVLDSADMIGNPYAFDTYFQQEKLFDITDIFRINKMQLQFYQKGDFKQNSGEVFPTYEDENLFVKDIYISLGYDANEFENDTVSIYSFGSPSYDTKADPGELNHRELNVRWIHRMPNDIIKAVDEKDDINYTITWYKYRLGAYSYTPQSGVDWVPLSEQIVEWKIDELGKRVKTVTLNILDKDWQNYNLTAEAGYVRQPEFNKTWLIPDITLAEENIKVIISYKVGSQQIYVYSDLLTFKNRQEVVNKPTVDAVSALSIVCEDGTFGNYRIYNQGNELINPAEGTTERVFKAYFKGEPLKNAESIEWIIPAENSMIVLENNYYAPDRTWDDTERVSMKRYGDKSKKWDIEQSNSQKYKIRGYYAQQYANNTIQCKVIKDKITYTATKELTFGPAGTSGSDYTLILDFDDGFTAIPFLGTEFLKDGKPDVDKVKSALVQESYGITARLYDFENKEINFKNGVSNFKIEWDFYTAPSVEKVALTLSSGWKTIREVDKEDPTKEIITKIDDETGCKQRLNIDYSKLDIDSLYIVQATLRWRGEQPVEGTEITPQVLTAYLSIPIYKYLHPQDVIDETTNEKIAELIIQPSFIGGAKQVIYMSNGMPNYYKNAYQIFYNEYNELEDKTLFVKNTGKWDEDITWNLIGQPELDEYSPECDRQNGNSLTDQRNKLKPSSIYIKYANQYGVQCKKKRVDSELYDTIWTQPIFVTMNRYPNSMINKWDGKTLEIDKEKGSILATAIAAGKKETWINNEGKEETAFTGVMLGDWSTSTLGDLEESLIKTGIYGFHRGEQSFAFTEDGKAFIGKSNRGRIYLDGDNGSIYSHTWDIDNDTISVNHGMHLDIDDGHIAMYRNDVYQRYSLSKSNFNANSEDVFIWKEYQILLNHPTDLPEGTHLYTPISFEKDNNINRNNYVNYKYYKKLEDGVNKINKLTFGQFDHLTGKRIEYTDEQFSQLKTLIDENYYNFTSDILSSSTLTSNKEFSIFCYDENKSFIGQLKYNSSNESFYLGPILIDLVQQNQSENLNQFDANDETIIGSKINGLVRKEKEDGSVFVGIETEENKAIEKKIAYIRVSVDASDEVEININSNITISIDTNIVASASGESSTNTYELIKVTPSSYDNIYTPVVFNKNALSYNDKLDLSTGMYYIELKKYITLKEAKKYNNNLTFDAKETYYKLGQSYYIDLGVDEEKIPLSIGTESSKSSRNFYVEWDGTLHAKNGLFEGTIESSIIKGGYIEAADIVGKSTITGATINGGVVNGAQIYFGEGEFYLYRGSDGTELKTANDLGTTFTAAGITYSLITSKSAEKAGYLGYSKGGYVLDGKIVESGVLVLDSTVSANGNIDTSEETLPIIVRSNDRVLIYSQDSWVMLQTAGGGIQIMKDGSVWFKDGAADAKKQHNIYARFA